MKISGLFFTLFIPFLLFTQEVKHEHSSHYSFMENKGQWPSPILFKSAFQGGNLWIQQHKFIFHLQDFSVLQKMHGYPTNNGPEPIVPQALVHLNFLGSNKTDSITYFNPSQHYYNFFIGNDSSKWTNNVHSFSEAILNEFYNGIDLKLIEEKEQLKYEFHVKPFVDPAQIQFEYNGNEAIKIDKNGNLIVKTALGNIIEQKPVAYQIVNGKYQSVTCDFKITDQKVTFKIGNYSKNIPLIIDPVLVFATYSGSVTDNFGMTATYGHDGSAYSGGMVYGNAYPTPDNNAYDVTSNFTVPTNANYGITDAFISKYAADGSTMLWTTFLGGGDATQGTETAQSMICDALDNVYLLGSTSSIDFPIVNGFQSTHAGGQINSNHYFNGVYFTNQGTDIYVAKISANGHNLLASTYMGGSGNDGVNTKVTSGIYNSVASYDSLTTNYGDQFRGEIMLDPIGNCLVASCTRSQNFPVLNAIQPSNAGMQDGVIFSLNANLSSLNWSTYFGGSNNEACYSIKVDSSLNLIVGGGTSSQNLPATLGRFQSNYNGGKTDGFITKFAASGTSIIGTTYLGTTNYDQVFFVEIDRDNSIFAVGQSQGGQFPVLNANFVNPNSSQFIIKLDSLLIQNQHSTTFGNGNTMPNISPAAFLVDLCGNLYVSGWGANILQGTPLTGMPVSSNAFQATAPNGFDFYLFVLDRNFNNLLYGSYLGGNSAQEHVDGGTSRFDRNGIVYQSVCGGCGGFSDFPTTTNTWSNSNLSSNCNNIVFKFDFQLIPTASFTVNETQGCAPFQVVFQNSSSSSDAYLWDFGNGDTSTTNFNPIINYTNPGVYNVYLYVTDSVCLLTDTAQTTVTISSPIQLTMPATVNMCSPVELNLTPNSFGTGTTFIWSSTINFTDTLNSSITDSVLTITPPGSGTYYLQVSNGGCQKTDSVSVEFTSSAIQLSANDSICKGDSSLITVTNLNPTIQFTYTWTPATIVSPTSGNSVWAQPLSTQFIVVTANSSTGCLIKDSILIAVSSIDGTAVIASASNYTVPVGATVTLLGQPSGYSYQWSPSVGVQYPTQQQTSAQVDVSTIYTFSVTDGICTKSDTVQIKTVNYLCGNAYIYVPNAFSPNSDGENDVLYVRGQMIENMLFRIFDRWGELIFESTNRLDGWDGTYKGKQLDPDVYDYYLQATCIDGNEAIIKGNITLLK